VFLGQRIYGQGNSWKIYAFALTQDSAINDPADDVCPGCAFHCESDSAIVEQEFSAGLDHACEIRVVSCYPFLITDDVLSRQDKQFAGLQRDRLPVFELAGSYFWARKIHQDRQRPFQVFGSGTRTLDVFCLLFLSSMRHVYAHAVSARTNQVFYHSLIARCRSEGRQNFRFTHLSLLVTQTVSLRA